MEQEANSGLCNPCRHHKLIVVYFLGLPLDYFRKIDIETATITAFFIDKNDFRLMTLSSPSVSHILSCNGK
jgi:hypothetical protein